MQQHHAFACWAGLRPIAIGELLRRLTAKCLMHEVRADAKTYLWPAQVGVL
jgi:hypothetical protein